MSNAWLHRGGAMHNEVIVVRSCVEAAKICLNDTCYYYVLGGRAYIGVIQNICLRAFKSQETYLDNFSVR